MFMSIKSVIYSRVSGLGQVSGDGFSRQHDACYSFADSHGYEIIREFREEAISGKTDMEDRPAFQEMISELLGNGCRTILIESMDRLARQYDVQQQLATYIASKSIALISCNTGEDISAALQGDPMRRALVQIQGIFAELDKNMLVAKLRKARERQRAQGVRMEGQKPYGVLTGEAEILTRIRQLRGDGATTDGIANHFNSCGTLTRSGRPWRGSTVRKILAREVA
jgi:DNA invertase Pin-like site-specific DNA recombinase